MTEPEDPSLDDVITATEPSPKDRHEHGKAPRRIDDDVLDEKVAIERDETGNGPV
jgi:hypothetical protein